MNNTVQEALREYATALRVAGAAEEEAERYLNTRSRVLWERVDTDRKAAVARRDAALRALDFAILRTGFGTEV